MASVDVVVPCYQYGRYLRDCVASVLSQDIRNLRVLIIDNASTDNSLEVAYELALEDHRVEVVAHRTNVGRNASYNEGIEWASSDYFMILCADDMLAPGCLSRAVSFMKKNQDVHLTYGRALYICGDDPMPHIESYTENKWKVFSGREFLEWICRGGQRHSVAPPTTLTRTSVQKRVGFYRRELPHTDDYEMWMRFACLGAVARTDAVQGIFRDHAESLSASVGNFHNWLLHLEAAFDSFFHREGASVPGAMRLYRTAQRTLAHHAYWSAWANFLRRGEARKSRDLWKFARKHCPTTIIVPPVGYLLRTDDVVKRITLVVSEAVTTNLAKA
jgi:glycosyltransferase involved in cell wall biosynthesis